MAQSDNILALWIASERGIIAGGATYADVMKNKNDYTAALNGEHGVSGVKADIGPLGAYDNSVSGLLDGKKTLFDVRIAREAYLTSLNNNIGREQALHPGTGKRTIDTLAPLKARIAAAIKAEADPAVIAALQAQLKARSDRLVGGTKAALDTAVAAGASPAVIADLEKEHAKALGEKDAASGSALPNLLSAAVLVVPAALAWWLLRRR
jgi:hypothetical protein